MQNSAHGESANKLVKKYYKEIFAFVYKQSFDEQLALDLTQEVFIRMLQSISNFDPKRAAFRTWLYRIASNHCIDYFRSKSFQAVKQTIYVEEIEIDGIDDVIEQVETKEQLVKVNELLLKFDSELQQIVRYKVFLELTFQEISSLMNLPESTVKTKYYAVIKKLRKEMKAYVIG
ncbi:sigma-70 family RNA polymerase sigma factor [Lysinibacillus fusiformis]|nr:sigma-70 family RNA polymerase sigma factor [Lysinibacillus fusiformis]